MEQLNTKAIRLHLLWGYWKPERTDIAVTQTANAQYGVKGGRGHYDKELFSPEFMKGLRNHTSATKSYYYTHTLPWEDKVARLVSVRQVETVVAYLNRAVMTYEEILRATVGDEAAYAQAVYDQRVWLTHAWNIKDYPSREEFMKKYHGSVRVMPLTTVTDLRCELSDNLREQIMASVKSDTEERFRLAMADCWKRLYEPVKKMAEVLAVKDQTFRDTLISNIVDVCAVLPELNILDDPVLTAMGEQVMESLKVDPDTLRENAYQRAEYAKKADELADILNRMGVN